MKRLGLAIIILGGAWFGLKDIALRTYLTFGAPSLPGALSYTAPEHWATQPETVPPGAWETPWGIDAFVVLPPTGLTYKHGLVPADHEPAVRDTLLALQKLSPAIPGDTPAYAPFYRTPSRVNTPELSAQIAAEASADILAAFELYLTEANQGRGILLIRAASAAPNTGPLLARLQEDDLSNRFAGLVSFGPEDKNAPDTELVCAEILGGACYQSVETSTAFSPARLFTPNAGAPIPELNVIDAVGVAEAIKVQAANVSHWLDETQPKLAEPFFTTTVIETAPIFRPGASAPIDTEEDGGSEDN